MGRGWKIKNRGWIMTLESLQHSLCDGSKVPCEPSKHVITVLSPIPWLYSWATHLLVLLPFHIFQQLTLLRATITSGSLTLNPQHMLSKAKSKSGVELPHPRSTKVNLTCFPRTYTDQFKAYVSTGTTIIDFTKSWLLPCSWGANSASRWHAMWCWTLYI